MKWNIVSLRENPGKSESKHLVIPMGAFDSIMGIVMTQPVTVDATLTYNHDWYMLTGQLSTAWELQCSRCLEMFVFHVQVTLHERFCEGKPGEDRSEMTWFHGDDIDLSDVLRQNLLLSMPMKPVCSEECRGLCPHCGVNLNIMQCDCKNQQLDPRLSVLSKLLE